MLTITLTTDKPRYAPAESIGAELIVSNRGGRPVTLHFSSGQRYDLVVEDAQGNVMWQWSADQMFVQVLGEETLGPGREQIVYRERLPAPEVPGTYRFVGSVVSSDHPLSATITFTVAP